MGYYHMVQETIAMCFGIAGRLSLCVGFLSSVYIQETKKEELRKIVRIGNIVLHVLASIAVFVITEGAPVGIKFSILWGPLACIAIDQLVCKSSWLYNWIMPKRKEEDDEV